MAKNGQLFEEDFRNSLDLNNPNFFFYRFKDGTASWGGNNENIRFQSHNVADCMIFYDKTLFIIELKSHKGKSLPINCIRETQLQEMYKASEKIDVYPLIITFFQDLEECYALQIQDVIEYIENTDKKSISLDYFKEKGFKIDCTKRITRFRFNIVDFLRNFT